MDMVRPRARFDWLVELGGASAFALGCAYAALKLAPSLSMAPRAAMSLAGPAFFALGMLVMRTAPGRRSEHVLADFAIASIETDELLLDTPIEKPLLLDTPIEDDVLLLEDPLPKPDPASRVVQLFASLPMPTPGQLKERIDRHLAKPMPADASKALYAALDELRRSLR